VGPGFHPTATDASEAVSVPLPRLDELVRLVGESAAAQLRVGRLLSDRLGGEPGLLDDYRELQRVLHELQEKTMRARMVSLATIAGPLRRAVRDLARARGRSVRWELLGEETELDRHVLEQLREPLVALVRNAVDHGIEPPDERAAAGKPREGVVRAHARQIGAEVVISLSDDGRGIDLERVRQRAGGRALSEEDALEAIFAPGMSTASEVTDISGRGVGLDAVRTAVHAVCGRIEVRTSPGQGTEFRLHVPMTLAILRCLLVRAAGRAYAFPMQATATALAPPTEATLSAEGRPVVWAGADAIALSDLADVLGLPAASPAGGPVVVLATPGARHAFRVDELAGRRDVVVKDLGGVLPRLELMAGASVEADGSVLLVLDAGGLIAAARRRGPAPPGAAPEAMPSPAASPAPAAEPGGPRGRVLVVDDALTIRELQRSILRRAGYEVDTAADGEEALERLVERRSDLVLTDIEMPRMDGFALTAAIRGAAELSGTPVLILTSREDEDDRRRGLEAGADGYLVKSAFDEHALLTAVEQLLGEPE
jgi:two-component system chemotaxis sensor kinase CheA